MGEEKIEVLGPKVLVSVKVPCMRAREEGTSVEEFMAMYVLRKVEEEWSIASVPTSPLGSTERGL